MGFVIIILTASVSLSAVDPLFGCLTVKLLALQIADDDAEEGNKRDRVVIFTLGKVYNTLK